MDGSRDFDIGGVATITDDSFVALDPFQWPLRKGKIKGETPSVCGRPLIYAGPQGQVHRAGRARFA
jgi:hypothetical protein